MEPLFEIREKDIGAKAVESFALPYGLRLKWHGKTFLSPNNVKALVYSFLGIKFNIPFFGSAVLRKVEFNGKFSTSMIYNHLPTIDNFRKVDDDTVASVMDVKGKVAM